MGDRWIDREGVSLSVSVEGAGVPVVLLHGLTATRRYVVMGSRSLERSGHRVIAYDARGHGRSAPARTSEDYGYGELDLDLEAVLDGLGVERAVLAGASMGAHTSLAFALRRPDRVAGLVVITPAFETGHDEAPEQLARWDALAAGLRSGGVEGFLTAYAARAVFADRSARGAAVASPALQATVHKVIRQRLALHEHPEAVADALRAVPRSRPFADLQQLETIKVPTIVVASSDDADPEHPQAVGEAYAHRIPGARLITDEPGKSPIAWQGSRLSALIAEISRG